MTRQLRGVQELGDLGHDSGLQDVSCGVTSEPETTDKQECHFPRSSHLLGYGRNRMTPGLCLCLGQLQDGRPRPFGL